VRVDPEDADCWQIVAGERRWRAAQAAQLHEVPIVVRDFTDEETLEVAIIENVQRDDLNPLDEAQGYQQLIDRFGHTQGALAKVIGKSRPYIANALRLLSLPEEVRALLASGKLSAGHARALVTAEDPAGLARRVVAEGLTVRQTEELARKAAQPAKSAPVSEGKDADTKALEGDLSAALGLKVQIGHKSDGKGVVTIAYRSLDDLDNLCRLLSS
ncbi:MAG: ParB/RepB/Spo0J family partition protein, partial [Pseudomonadota bacterium]